VKRLGDEVDRELGRFGPEAKIAALVEAWPVAVGETIARSAWPARVARDGTLHVNTADSVWAFELTSRADDIAQRLGVERVRFTPGGFPSPPFPSRRTASLCRGNRRRRSSRRVRDWPPESRTKICAKSLHGRPLRASRSPLTTARSGRLVVC
jgi:hypothetical protein